MKFKSSPIHSHYHPTTLSKNDNVCIRTWPLIQRVWLSGSITYISGIGAEEGYEEHEHTFERKFMKEFLDDVLAFE